MKIDIQKIKQFLHIMPYDLAEMAKITNIEQATISQDVKKENIYTLRLGKAKKYMELVRFFEKDFGKMEKSNEVIETDNVEKFIDLNNAYQIAKLTDLNYQRAYKYKNKQSKIENMSLEIALKMDSAFRKQVKENKKNEKLNM